MKKILVASLLLVLAFSLMVSAANYKIGVITGTVSQGEDEYRGAEAMAKKYPEIIIHKTYPDNFMAEQETFISQVTSLASDRNVKAIVINQGVPGTLAAIKKVKELRPDILFFIGQPHEDYKLVGAAADFSLNPDDETRGRTIPQLAKAMGAKTFIHYSFPRHMAMAKLSQRRDIMKEECEKLGVNFVFVTAPDPMAEGGLPAAQQFILEDVPRQVAKYGKDTAFFSTNCGMQEPLIKSVIEQKALFPEQCCPSPTHGYPGAIGLEVTADMKGNFIKIFAAVESKAVSLGMAGRMATWPVAAPYLQSTGTVELAKRVLDGSVKLTDDKAIQKVYEESAGQGLSVFKRSSGNYFVYLVAGKVFGK
ncbi:MAG TPA: DUF3798 domain-containing protein [Bacillota bacterium]|nr:MAG: hypothetical protein BWY00_01584 [Firmicutes bacterium ADurb.Bin153]HNV34633.1 DUF3798 domain-containing protein [Bacillota bacterium]HPU95283.1 DUF3798 domain-containing protein [Bacillota bacterium]